MGIRSHIKWIGLLYLIGCSSAHSASFDCQQARTSIEKLICSTDALSSLDDRLGQAYRASMQGGNDKETLQAKEEQARWLRQVRNKCMDTECLLRSYTKRVEELGPFADKKISCEEMRRFPTLIFSDGIDLGSGHGSPIEVDYRCPDSLSQQTFMLPLLELAEQIRGDDGPQNCSGSIVYAQWRYYSFNLAWAGISPLTLLKASESARQGTDWESMANALDAADVFLYFKRWSEQSQTNLKLYSAFAAEFDRVLPQLIQHYKVRFGLPISDAQAAAKSALMMPLIRAAGSFPSAEQGSESDLEKLVRDSKASADDIRKAVNFASTTEEKLTENNIYQALVIALLYKRPLEVVSLLAEKLPLNTLLQSENNQEPLLSFAIGSQENLEYLLERNVPVNAVNDFGKTSLFYAIGSNDHGAVKMLLRYGADVNQSYKSAKELRPDDDMCTYYGLKHTQRTPLMHAAQHGDLEMLKLIIEAGAPLSVVDDLGFNALDYAVLGKRQENQSYLRSVGLQLGAPAYTSDADPSVSELTVRKTIPIDGFVSKLLIAPGRPNLLTATVTPWNSLLAGDKHGLYLISISDPDEPKVTSVFSGAYINDFAISPDGTRAYLMEMADIRTPITKKFGVTILDISDGARPTVVGRIDGDFMTMHLSPDGKVLYLQERELKPEFSRGLLVYSVEKNQPALECSNPFGKGISGRVFAYSFTSFPDEPLLLINDRGADAMLFDIGKPCAPKKLLDFPSEGFGGPLTGAAQRTVLGTGAGELKRIHLENSPVRIAGYGGSISGYHANKTTGITAAVIGQDVAVFRTGPKDEFVLSDRFRMVLPNYVGSVFVADTGHIYIGWKDGLGIGFIP